MRFMITRYSNLALAILAALTCAAMLVYRAKAMNLERERDVQAFRADSVEAVADTTRRVAGMWEKRSVQMEIERDSIDDLLRQKSVVKAKIFVRVDTQYVEAVAESHADTADFHTHQTPFDINAHVVMPDTGLATAAFRVSLDPIPLSVRLGCQNAKPIKKATIAVKSPDWAKLQMDSVYQDKSVCNPDSPAVRRRGHGRLLMDAAFIGTVLFVLRLK